jgi:hypothetical protein
MASLKTSGIFEWVKNLQGSSTSEHKGRRLLRLKLDLGHHFCLYQRRDCFGLLRVRRFIPNSSKFLHFLSHLSQIYAEPRSLTFYTRCRRGRQSRVANSNLSISESSKIKKISRSIRPIHSTTSTTFSPFFLCQSWPLFSWPWTVGNNEFARQSYHEIYLVFNDATIQLDTRTRRQSLQIPGGWPEEDHLYEPR